MAMGPTVSTMMFAAGLSGMNKQQQNEQQAAPGEATSGQAPGQTRDNALQMLAKLTSARTKRKTALGSGGPMAQMTTLLGVPGGN